MKMRTLIVDDEPLARQRLRQLLGRESDVEVVGECGDGVQAVQLIETLNPDLVLLDVRMPELDGFGVVEAVGPEHMPATLFITAYDEYARQAFEAQAVDYLLKPFDPDRFARAIQRARTWVGARRLEHASAQGPELEALLARIHAERTAYADRFLVRQGERHLLVRASLIQWVEAEDNYVRLHVDGTSYLLRQTMSGILKRLEPRRFRRIHRSAIVNLDAILELQPWNSGDYLVIMRDGTKLTLSRTYRDAFAEGW
jgi:two-component system, LytTR family, response regulator